MTKGLAILATLLVLSTTNSEALECYSGFGIEATGYFEKDTYVTDVCSSFGEQECYITETTFPIEFLQTNGTFTLAGCIGKPIGSALSCDALFDPNSPLGLKTLVPAFKEQVIDMLTDAFYQMVGNLNLLTANNTGPWAQNLTIILNTALKDSNCKVDPQLVPILDHVPNFFLALLKNDTSTLIETLQNMLQNLANLDTADKDIIESIDTFTENNFNFTLPEESVYRPLITKLPGAVKLLFCNDQSITEGFDEFFMAVKDIKFQDQDSLNRGLLKMAKLFFSQYGSMDVIKEYAKSMCEFTHDEQEMYQNFTECYRDKIPPWIAMTGSSSSMDYSTYNQSMECSAPNWLLMYRYMACPYMNETTMMGIVSRFNKTDFDGFDSVFAFVHEYVDEYLPSCFTSDQRNALGKVFTGYIMKTGDAFDNWKEVFDSTLPPGITDLIDKFYPVNGTDNLYLSFMASSFFQYAKCTNMSVPLWTNFTSNLGSIFDTMTPIQLGDLKPMNFSSLISNINDRFGLLPQETINALMSMFDRIISTYVLNGGNLDANSNFLTELFKDALKLVPSNSYFQNKTCNLSELGIDLSGMNGIPGFSAIEETICGLLHGQVSSSMEQFFDLINNVTNTNNNPNVNSVSLNEIIDMLIQNYGQMVGFDHGTINATVDLMNAIIRGDKNIDKYSIKLQERFVSSSAVEFMNEIKRLLNDFNISSTMIIAQGYQPLVSLYSMRNENITKNLDDLLLKLTVILKDIDVNSIDFNNILSDINSQFNLFITDIPKFPDLIQLFSNMENINWINMTLWSDLTETIFALLPMDSVMNDNDTCILEDLSFGIDMFDYIDGVDVVKDTLCAYLKKASNNTKDEVLNLINDLQNSVLNTNFSNPENVFSLITSLLQGLQDKLGPQSPASINLTLEIFNLIQNGDLDTMFESLLELQKSFLSPSARAFLETVENLLKTNLTPGPTYDSIVIQIYQPFIYFYSVVDKNTTQTFDDILTKLNNVLTILDPNNVNLTALLLELHTQFSLIDEATMNIIVGIVGDFNINDLIQNGNALYDTYWFSLISNAINSLPGFDITVPCNLTDLGVLNNISVISGFEMIEKLTCPLLQKATNSTKLDLINLINGLLNQQTSDNVNIANVMEFFNNLIQNFGGNLTLSPETINTTLELINALLNQDTNMITQHSLNLQKAFVSSTAREFMASYEKLLSDVIMVNIDTFLVQAYQPLVVLYGINDPNVTLTLDDMLSKLTLILNTVDTTNLNFTSIYMEFNNQFGLMNSSELTNTLQMLSGFEVNNFLTNNVTNNMWSILFKTLSNLPFASMANSSCNFTTFDVNPKAIDLLENLGFDKGMFCDLFYNATVNQTQELVDAIDSLSNITISSNSIIQEVMAKMFKVILDNYGSVIKFDNQTTEAAINLLNAIIQRKDMNTINELSIKFSKSLLSPTALDFIENIDGLLTSFNVTNVNSVLSPIYQTLGSLYGAQNQNLTSLIDGYLSQATSIISGIDLINGNYSSILIHFNNQFRLLDDSVLKLATKALNKLSPLFTLSRVTEKDQAYWTKLAEDLLSVIPMDLIYVNVSFCSLDEFGFDGNVTNLIPGWSTLEKLSCPLLQNVSDSVKHELTNLVNKIPGLVMNTNISSTPDILNTVKILLQNYQSVLNINDAAINASLDLLNAVLKGDSSWDELNYYSTNLNKAMLSPTALSFMEKIEGILVEANITYTNTYLSSVYQTLSSLYATENPNITQFLDSYIMKFSSILDNLDLVSFNLVPAIIEIHTQFGVLDTTNFNNFINVYSAINSYLSVSDIGSQNYTYWINMMQNVLPYFTANPVISNFTGNNCSFSQIGIDVSVTSNVPGWEMIEHLTCSLLKNSSSDFEQEILGLINTITGSSSSSNSTSSTVIINSIEQILNSVGPQVNISQETVSAMIELIKGIIKGDSMQQINQYSVNLYKTMLSTEALAFMAKLEDILIGFNITNTNDYLASVYQTFGSFYSTNNEFLVSSLNEYLTKLTVVIDKADLKNFNFTNALYELQHQFGLLDPSSLSLFFNIYNTLTSQIFGIIFESQNWIETIINLLPIFSENLLYENMTSSNNCTLSGFNFDASVTDMFPYWDIIVDMACPLLQSIDNSTKAELVNVINNLPLLIMETNFTSPSSIIANFAPIFYKLGPLLGVRPEILNASFEAVNGFLDSKSPVITNQLMTNLFKSFMTPNIRTFVNELESLIAKTNVTVPLPYVYESLIGISLITDRNISNTIDEYFVKFTAVIKEIDINNLNMTFILTELNNQFGLIDSNIPNIIASSSDKILEMLTNPITDSILDNEFWSLIENQLFALMPPFNMTETCSMGIFGLDFGYMEAIPGWSNIDNILCNSIKNLTNTKLEFDQLNDKITNLVQNTNFSSTPDVINFITVLVKEYADKMNLSKEIVNATLDLVSAILRNENVELINEYSTNIQKLYMSENSIKFAEQVERIIKELNISGVDNYVPYIYQTLGSIYQSNYGNVTFYLEIELPKITEILKTVNPINLDLEAVQLAVYSQYPEIANNPLLQNVLFKFGPKLFKSIIMNDTELMLTAIGAFLQDNTFNNSYSYSVSNSIINLMEKSYNIVLPQYVHSMIRFFVGLPYTYDIPSVTIDSIYSGIIANIKLQLEFNKLATDRFNSDLTTAFLEYYKSMNITLPPQILSLVNIATPLSHIDFTSPNFLNELIPLLNRVNQDYFTIYPDSLIPKTFKLTMDFAVTFTSFSTLTEESVKLLLDVMNSYKELLNITRQFEVSFVEIYFPDAAVYYKLYLSLPEEKQEELAINVIMFVVNVTADPSSISQAAAQLASVVLSNVDIEKEIKNILSPITCQYDTCDMNLCNDQAYYATTTVPPTTVQMTTTSPITERTTTDSDTTATTPSLTTDTKSTTDTVTVVTATDQQSTDQLLSTSDGVVTDISRTTESEKESTSAVTDVVSKTTFTEKTTTTISLTDTTPLVTTATKTTQATTTTTTVAVTNTTTTVAVTNTTTTSSGCKLQYNIVPTVLSIFFTMQLYFRF